MGGKVESSMARTASGGGGANGAVARERCGGGFFQMPLHYPRYTRAEYEAMPEWQVDCLLAQYGLHVGGDVHHKRRFAIGAFLWTC